MAKTTARKVLAQLREEGLIVTTPGALVMIVPNFMRVIDAGP